MTKFKTRANTVILVMGLSLGFSMIATAGPCDRVNFAPNSSNFYSSQTGSAQFQSDRRVAFNFKKGVRLYSKGNLHLAEISFKKVLDSSPQFSNAYYYKTNAFMGLINAQQNDHKSAVGYFRRAVAGNPDIYGLKSALGLSYIELGKMQKAQAILADLKNKKDRSIYQGSEKIDLRSSITVLEHALSDI